MSRPRVRTSALVLAMTGLVLLTGCAPDDGGQAAPTSAGPVASETADASPTPTGSPSPSPTGTAEATPAIPTDCKAIVSASVLAELDGVPLNDPAFGPSGAQGGVSLTCIWRDPAADTTGLTTTITKMASGPALDMLNGLVANEGFTCFTPDGGTRCEKTWQNPTYPVTDGRTLFYRSGVLVDTQYSNLAPSGYTASIIAHLFPA